MSIDEFKSSLSHAGPPDGWSRALQALWWDAHDDWERAHGLVQMDEADPQCAWVHAYLHRKEGDLPNADLVPPRRAAPAQRAIRDGMGGDRVRAVTACRERDRQRLG